MKNKQTILIVDDVKENVDVLVELLTEHDLVTALDAKTALDILEEESVDLILLDVMMPEMDGFELCSILKEDPKTVHIPIIFLTAKDRMEDIQKGFSLGGVDYIVKPFKPYELLARVQTHLQLRAYETGLELRVEEEMEKNRLKEQILFQKEKQASLGELLMHIAHQWKQPLSALGSINMLNYSKMMSDKSIAPQELLHSIKKSEHLISYMSKTIDTFQKFYEPSQEEEESFFLNDCLLSVLSIVEVTFDFENIKIVIHSHEMQKSRANVNEISQIIFTLLSNARNIFKERKIKNPEITITIENQKISIVDNGGGVEERLLERVFLPFVSGYNSSGMGLSLSRAIAEKNGAVLEVENETKGAKFTLEFIEWTH